MGLLSAAMKTELRKQAPKVFSLAEIDFPDGTVRYAKAGVMSDTNGPYLPIVQTFGTVTRKVSPRQNSLTPVSTSLTIRDNPRDTSSSSFGNRAGRGQRILNSAARLYIGSPNVAEVDWYQAFGGLLTGWRQPQVGQWALGLQTPDVKLAGMFPRYQLSTIDFANMDKGAKGTARKDRRVTNTVTLGSYTPLVYGQHDDYGDGSAGTIPCPLIDSVNFWHLVGLGWINVVRVYADGVLLTTGYSIARTTVNGRYYTYIDFTTTRNTQTITADVEGYETVGDGTGTMICDPVGVFQHLCTNFFLNDNPGATWTATDSTFFDTTSWTAVQTALRNRACGAAYTCARYISNQLTGTQALNEMCKSFGLTPYWTNTGKLGLAIDNPNVAYPDTYVSDPFFRYEEEAPILPAYDGGDNCNRIIATFENIAAGGSGTSTSNTTPKEYYQLEANDPLSAALRDDHVSLTWGPSTFP